MCGIINQIIPKTHQKMKSTNFNMLPTPSKTLGNYLKKKEGLKMVLSYCLQQNVVVEAHMI